MQERSVRLERSPVLKYPCLLPTEKLAVEEGVVLWPGRRLGLIATMISRQRILFLLRALATCSW